MKTETYNKIIEKIKCDESTKQLIGFNGSLGSYEINFYAEQENGYKLQVDSFGYKSKSGWIQQEPTTEQIELMEKKIQNAVDCIQSEPKELESTSLRNLYQENGVSPLMFI